MKNRVLLVVLVMAVLLAFALVARAQQGMPDMSMMTAENGGDNGNMMPGRGGMMGEAAIAVSDGDVYVVAGGMLLKYNRDLELVAQAELPGVEMGGRGMGRRGGGGGRGMGPGGGGGRGMGPGMGGMMNQ